MTIGVVSGFAPAQASQPASAGVTGSAAAPADGPPGMFDAILSMFSAPPAEAVAKAVKSSFEPAASTTLQTATAALAGQFNPPAPMVATDADSADAATGTQLMQATPAPQMLRDLVDQLTALQEQIADATPLDAVTEKRLADTLETLAAALGIELPATAPIAPAITAAATPATTPAGALDPLPTIEAAATAVLAAVATATSAAPAAILSADDTSPYIATLPVTEATAVEPQAPAVSPLLEKLAAKLGELAEALVPKAPELAKKLEVFAAKLAAGEVDTAELAKLGLDPAAETADADVAAAIERLLAPRAGARPLAQPAPFTAATLVLPGLGGSKAANPTEGAAPGSIGVAPASDEAVEQDAEPFQQVRSADRGDRPEQPQGRSSFSAAFQASLNADAPPQQATPPAAAAGVAVVGSAVAADTKAIHAAYRAPVQQINMPQMAVEIVRQAEAGNSRFQIRLDPPELGRIDVKLDVDKAGNVNARLTVERAETLDLMQRDQRSLEKALAQAGLDTSKTNLEFSLRQNPFGRDGQQQQQGGNGQPGFPRFGVAEADDVIPAPHVAAYRGYASTSGVNLFV